MLQAMSTRRTDASNAHRGSWSRITNPAILALVASSGRGSRQPARAPRRNPAEPPPPKVTVADVVSRDVTEWDEFTGRLEAVNTVAVRPRVSGFVAAVRFEEGAIVRRGDLLFQIDPRPFEAEADRLRAELARAKATGERATSELQRAARLAEENAMSHEEQERRAAFAQESTAQVAAVEAALRAAELNLEFTQVTSPIDGRVGRAIVTQGNLVSSGPGEATLLTTVVSLDPIYAVVRCRRADVPASRGVDTRRRARAAARSCRSAWRWPATGVRARGQAELSRQPDRSGHRHHPRPRRLPQCRTAA